MVLGASISFGLRSSDGNGYRDVLRGLLIQSGTQNVQYVGSRRSGTMDENAVEGWPGLRIDQVLPKAQASVPVDLPNVILLNLGTNDCVQNFNLDNTTQPSQTAPELTANANFTVGTRMRMVVEDLLQWSPNVTVVMSTLINNKVERVQNRTLDANDQFRAVAADLQGQGKKVVIAEMSAAAGGPNMTTMFDQTHPTDVGYSMMANRFYVAMQEASSKGMISAPIPK
jgi:lysophospholipase L1-like esterase